MKISVEGTSRQESVAVNRRRAVGRTVAALGLAGIATMGAHELMNTSDATHEQNVKFIKDRLMNSAEFWDGAVETQPKAELLDAPSRQSDTTEGLQDNPSSELSRGTTLKFPYGGLYITGNDGNRYAVTIVPTENASGPVDFPRTVDELAEHAKLVPYDDMFPGKDARNSEPTFVGADINNILQGLPKDFEIAVRAGQ